MHLRNFKFALFLSGVICSASNVVAESVPAPTSEQPLVSQQEIAHAIDQLKADPNLAIESKVHTLKWKEKDKEDEKKKRTNDLPAWLNWIGDFFSWLGETARVLVWAVAAIFAAILIVWIIRYVRGLDGRGISIDSILAPTHVRDLDIRPESLPQDIGKAALELWQRGEHRSSLSLLYRGLLSRLVHKYAVPIRQSSTEGECRALALQSLPAQSHAYVTSLIQTWQGAVYGGNDPSEESVHYLCSQFVILDQAAASSTPVASLGPITASSTS